MRTVRRLTRESREELRNLAAALRGALFERLNPLARRVVGHSRHLAISFSNPQKCQWPILTQIHITG
jgi:hypothetical protein